MNYGRLAAAAAAAWIADGLYGFIVYGNLMTSEFALYPGVFRPLEAMNAKMPFLFAGLLLTMFVATFIYAKGYEGGAGFPEGARFGAWSGCSGRGRAGQLRDLQYRQPARRVDGHRRPRGVDHRRHRDRARLPAGAVGVQPRAPEYDPECMTTASKPKAGLEDTVATSSAICYLDGDRGVLAYAATTSTISRGTRPSKRSAFCCGAASSRRAPSSATCSRQLVAARPLPEPVLRLMRALPAGQHDGRAADADLGARPLRSGRERPVAAGQLPRRRCG